MKKLIALLLVILLSFSMSACSSNSNTQPNNSTPSVGISASPPTTSSDSSPSNAPSSGNNNTSSPTPTPTETPPTSQYDPVVFVTGIGGDERKETGYIRTMVTSVAYDNDGPISDSVADNEEVVEFRFLMMNISDEVIFIDKDDFSVKRDDFTLPYTSSFIFIAKDGEKVFSDIVELEPQAILNGFATIILQEGWKDINLVHSSQHPTMGESITNMLFSQDNVSGEWIPKPSEPERVTVPEGVIFEQDGVRITLRSLEADTRGRTELNVLIENDSTDPITVQVRDVSVNGIMFTSTVFSSGVTAGNKKNDSITFQSWGFERYGINEIGTIELAFRIINESNRDRSYTSEIITIQTSISERVSQPLPETRELLFERDGLTISLLGIEEARSGVDVVFFIINGTDRNITIQARDENVNGFMISGTMSTGVQPGKMSIDTLSFSDRRLGENGINSIADIESITFALRIIDEDNRNGSYNTPAIEITP